MPGPWNTSGNTVGSEDFLGSTNAQPLVVRTNGTERLRVLADGKVGVGLGEPRTPLHVLGRMATGLDHTSAGSLTFYPPDGFAWFHIDNGPSGTRPTGRLRFSHGPNPGSSEIMCLLQNGNVGVGTSAPAVKFHVAGNRARVESGGKRLDMRADGGAVDVQSDTSTLYLHSSGPSGKNHVVINPFVGQGNVGVGTQGPAVKLHVVGNRVRVESGGKRLDLRADGGAVDVQSETSSVYLHSSGPSGKNHVIMNPFGGQGNVGIGTQGPTAKLHVVGDVRANDFLLTSDARLKEDVRPITGALAKLQRMRGVEFAWRADKVPGLTNRRRLGVIAQEVESVAPELVHADTDDSPKGVDVSGMVGMLVEAVKDLVAENGTLRRRVEALEAAQGAGA